MKAQIIKYTGTILLYLFSMFPLLAEGDEEDYPGHPESWDDTPIDHWELVLGLAAVLIGIYCLKKYRKRIEV